MMSLVKNLLQRLTDPLSTSTHRSRGVTYTMINGLPLRRMENYSPKYDYSVFKKKYESLYKVNPILVEKLFEQYLMTFCGGKEPYTIIRNFIIGYQLLYGKHLPTDREFSFDHRIQPSLGEIDELRINFPDHRFRYQKGYEGDDFWCIRYTGNGVPDERIIKSHNKLGSK